MPDFRLFLTVDCGHNLPVMDRIASDPYVQIWYSDSPPKSQNAEHQFPINNTVKEARASAQDGEDSNRQRRHPDVPHPPIFVGTIDVGRTKTIYGNNFNPAWSWRLDQEIRIKSVGRRGWIVFQVFDEDSFEDEVMGQVTINLDEVRQDMSIEGWYSTGPNDTDGLIKIRMLLCSVPEDLCDSKRAWLLDDFDIVRIYEEVQWLSSVQMDPNRQVDRTRKRQRQADQARLSWHAAKLLDDIFGFLDTDNSGGISPKELYILMSTLGETVSPVELGHMIAEAKAWGRRELPDFMDEMAEFSRGQLGSLGSEPDPIVRQEILTRLFGEPDPILPQCRCKDAPAPEDYDAPARLDIDINDSELTLSWDEFKLMLSEYWTCRKYSSTTEVSGVSGKRGLNRFPPFNPDVDEWGRGGVGSDKGRTTMEDLVHVKGITEFVQGRPGGFCGRGEIHGIGEMPIPPEWMRSVANNHKKIPEKHRTPQMFWFFVRCATEQLLMRASHKALDRDEAKVVENDWKEKQEARSSKNKALSMNFTDVTLRSIGSADGMISPSNLSIAWDLMQVVLLMYVLTSVPFAIAFDVNAQVGSGLWFWELWVDTYFLLDILLYFRTPYLLQLIMRSPLF